MIVAWLSAFLLTQAVEVPIYLRGLSRDRPTPFRRWPAALAVAFAASAITHPIVWFVMPRLVPGEYVVMVAIAEGFAIATEGAWLHAFGLRRAWLWAVCANAASVFVGLGLRSLFGWP